MADSKAILDEQLHKKAKGGQTKPLADVIAEWMRAELQSALQKAIDAEFSVHIGYEAGKKPEGSDDPNVRNGGCERTIDAEYGPVIVRMPRARESGFEPEVAPKYSRSTSFVADVVCALYRANLSGSQIQEVADSLYGVGVSESRITAVVDAVAGDAESFRKSPLPKKAFALFADSVFIPLRRGTVSREAVNILMAIGEDGYPYVVGFSITPEESASEWRSVFERVRQRGLEKAFVVVSGGIAGMAEAVKACFPNARRQRCLVHVARNVAAKVGRADKGDVMSDFLAVAKAKDPEDAASVLGQFLDKWGEKYPEIIEWADRQDTDELFAFMAAPRPLWRYICSNNRIESFNKEIRRNCKVHVQWVTEDSEKLFLVTLFNRYNYRIGKRAILAAEEVAKFMADF